MAEELGKIIRAAGMLLKHAVGVMMLCWRRMLRAGLLAGVVGIILTEIAAMYMLHSPYPGWTAQLVAAAFGLALAYGVALSVFVEEFVRGVIDLVRQLEGDAAGAARATAHLAERELGDVHVGLQHLFGVAAPLAWAGAQVKSARATAKKRQAERQRVEAARRIQREREAEVARRRAVAEAQRRAVERKKAEEAAQQRAEVEAQRRAEEAKARAQRDAERKQAQAEAQQKAEAERLRRDAERKQAEDAERKKRAEEAKRRAEIEAGRRQAQEEARQRAEATRKRQAEEAEAIRRQQDDERKQRAAAAAASLSAAAGAFTAAVRAPTEQRAQAAPTTHTDEQQRDLNGAEQQEDVSLASITQTPYTPMAPVPASSLPRIEWSYEHPAVKLPRESGADDRPTAETVMAPEGAETLAAAANVDDPDATFRRAVAAMRAPDATVAATSGAQGGFSQAVSTPRPGASYPQTPPPPRLQPVEAPIPVPHIGQPATSAASIAASSANVADSNANTPAVEAPTLPARQRGATQPAQPGATPAQGRGVPGQTVPNPNGRKKSIPITQPLNVVTRPLPTMSRPAPTGANSGLWERLSQALVGKPPTASRPLDRRAQQQADESNPLGDVRSLPPLPTEGLDDEDEANQS